MAITSHGYAGSFVPNKPWADMAQFGMGMPYWVQSSGSWLVTPVTAGTRQVSIASGIGGARGILDYSDASTVLTLSPVTTPGTTAYTMITVDRTWGATQATQFGTVVAGVSAPTTLPARATSYGIGTDQQPVALVSLSFGDTVPTVIADLRVIKEGSGIAQAFSELALQYLGFNGMQIKIGPNTWTCVYATPTSARQWMKDPGNSGRVALPTYVSGIGGPSSDLPGWQATGLVTAMRPGNRVEIDFASRRTGPAITSTTTPSISAATGAVSPNVHIFTFAEPYWPNRDKIIGGIYMSNQNTEIQGTFQLTRFGGLYLIAGTPGSSLRQVDASPASDISVRLTIGFTREDAS